MPATLSVIDNESPANSSFVSVSVHTLAKRYCMCMHAVFVFEVITLIEMLLHK